MTDVPCLVPEGMNATDVTLGELDKACNQISCDVLQAMAGEVPGKRYAACIEFLVIWARRAGGNETRAAMVERFRGYTTEQMSHALGMDREDEEPPDPTETGSTLSVESSGSLSPRISAGSLTS